jgi:plasmid maintenance system antidote protein VapI
MRKQTRISGELRQAIERARERGTSRYALWKLTGVGQPQLSAFVKQRESLSLDAADRIAEALGLRLVEDARPRKAPRRST